MIALLARILADAPEKPLDLTGATDGHFGLLDGVQPVVEPDFSGLTGREA